MAGFDEAQARAALTTMQERLTKGPFVTLGIDPSATADDVRAAFLGLTKRYHPAKFARMSGELQRLSNEVFLGIRGAHDTIARSLPKPSSSPRGSAPIRHATPPHGVPTESASGRLTPPRGLATNRAPSPPLGAQPRPKTPSNGATPGAARFTDPKSNPPSAALARGAPSGLRPTDPKSASGPRPAPKVPTPAFGVRVPPVTPPKSSLVGKTQPLPVVVPPSLDENAELATAQDQMRRGQWTQARQTLQALANRVSASRHYRAMLAYAKAKETGTDRLVAEAITELERFIQAEPTHAMAKAALADLRRK